MFLRGFKGGDLAVIDLLLAFKVCLVLLVPLG
jgi:hypothetical protein